MSHPVIVHGDFSHRDLSTTVASDVEFAYLTDGLLFLVLVSTFCFASRWTEENLADGGGGPNMLTLSFCSTPFGLNRVDALGLQVSGACERMTALVEHVAATVVVIAEQYLCGLQVTACDSYCPISFQFPEVN